jgi:hypothetical protein
MQIQKIKLTKDKVIVVRANEDIRDTKEITITSMGDIRTINLAAAKVAKVAYETVFGKLDKDQVAILASVAVTYTPEGRVMSSKVSGQLVTGCVKSGSNIDGKWSTNKLTEEEETETGSGDIVNAAVEALILQVKDR